MEPLSIPDDVRELTSTVTNFGEHAVWTGIHQREFGSWLRARKHVLTASAMPVLLGLDPWKDPLDLYVEKTREEEVAVPDKRELGDLSDPRMWGRELEQAIAQIVAKRRNWQLREGGALLVSRRHPLIGATLDDEVLPAGDEGLWCVYEGKTVTVFKSRDWDEEAQLPPDHVLLQTQGQLLVTGAPRAYVFALVGGNTPKQIEVHPDAELHAVMVEATEAFVERCRSLDPPPPTARSEKALKCLFPAESGETVDLSADDLEWTNEWLALGEQEREIKKRRDELKNLLRMSVGEASFGTLPGMVEGQKSPKRWKCVTMGQPEKIMPAWETRVLRLVNDPTKKTQPLDVAKRTSVRKRRRRI